MVDDNLKSKVIKRCSQIIEGKGNKVEEDMLKTSNDNKGKQSVFLPRDTCDSPCDVTLVIDDGKEVKAHRHILAQASPFFEKLLSSNMKESREGVIRLEMLTESVLGDILEFVYTGCVQISDEDRAQDLITMADYLVLPQLKSVAGRTLTTMLNSANCVSIYQFGERYQCKEVIAGTQQFILANFSAVATTKEFLNISREEVKMWTSSDEINVNAKEDVFAFIAKWIDHDEVERKKYFSELFCHVQGRLHRQFLTRFWMQFLRRF